jgi:hypothetical protein
MRWDDDENLRGAVARWRDGERGDDPAWKLRELIKQLIGHYATPLDEVIGALGATREQIVTNARIAAGELRDAARIARHDRDENIRVNEAVYLENCAANIATICGPFA